MNDWFAVLAVLIGLIVGALLEFLRESFASRRDKANESETWKRDKRAQVLEDAVIASASIIEASHSDHEQWRLRLAQIHFRLRLYCTSDTASAFKVVSDWFSLVSERGAFELERDPRLSTALGQINLYLHRMARHELGMESDVDPHQAKREFLKAIEDLRLARDDSNEEGRAS